MQCWLNSFEEMTGWESKWKKYKCVTLSERILQSGLKSFWCQKLRPHFFIFLTYCCSTVCSGEWYWHCSDAHSTNVTETVNFVLFLICNFVDYSHLSSSFRTEVNCTADRESLVSELQNPQCTSSDQVIPAKYKILAFHARKFSNKTW